jgi:hypothetical protein
MLMDDGGGDGGGGAYYLIDKSLYVSYFDIMSYLFLVSTLLPHA